MGGYSCPRIIKQVGMVADHACCMAHHIIMGSEPFICGRQFSAKLSAQKRNWVLRDKLKKEL
jgi:hypothetical protein